MIGGLAPVGLPSINLNSIKNVHFKEIEESISTAIREIEINSSEQDIIYNLSHPNTVAVLRSYDRFFSHGLNTADRCYWCFVRQFIPSSEQNDLKARWNCSRSRSLSFAWLMDSLNRSNLYFQILAFVSYPDSLKKKYYHKNACLLNKPLLKRVCFISDKLSTINFRIDSPYIFRPEETPIATSVIQITTLTDSDSLSSQNSHQVLQNAPINFVPGSHSKMRARTTNASCFYMPGSLNTENGSLSTLNQDTYLDSLVHNLPESNVPSFSQEPFISSAREQDFILDELVRSHRIRLNPCFESSSLDESSPLKQQLTHEQNRRMSERVLCVYEEKAICECEENPCLPEEVHEAENIDVSNLHFLELVSQNESDLLEIKQPFDIEEISPEDLHGQIIVDGEIPLESSEIVQLATNVFRQDAERFKRMFQIYTGHSSGCSQLRYLLITDLNVYLLSLTRVFYDVIPAEEVTLEAHNSPRESLSKNYDRNCIPKFSVVTVISPDDIDGILVGTEAQSICFNLASSKLYSSPNSGHENKRLVIETCNKHLGEVIASELRNMLISIRKSKTKDDSSRDISKIITVSSLASLQGAGVEIEFPSPQYASEFDLFITNFIVRELAKPNVGLAHMSLVFWQQNLSDPFARSDNDQGKCLEGYLYMREVQKSWTQKLTEWNQSYFVLRGSMFYQFTDSTCKFAERSLNIRDFVAYINRIELKNDEKYVFEVGLNVGSSFEPYVFALQFSCPSSEEVQKWMNRILLALSISNQTPMPIACTMILTTDRNVLFAQEGSNWIVDGFMRGINSFHCDEIIELFTLRLDSHNALVIRRENGISEWIFFREQSELDRIVDTLVGSWNIPIDGGMNGGSFLNTAMKFCDRLPDLWQSIHPFDEE